MVVGVSEYFKRTEMRVSDRATPRNKTCSSAVTIHQDEVEAQKVLLLKCPSPQSIVVSGNNKEVVIDSSLHP